MAEVANLLPTKSRVTAIASFNSVAFAGYGPSCTSMRKVLAMIPDKSYTQQVASLLADVLGVKIRCFHLGALDISFKSTLLRCVRSTFPGIMPVSIFDARAQIMSYSTSMVWRYGNVR
ncbi:unnamed protein product [Pylaiella littoralis]